MPLEDRNSPSITATFGVTQDWGSGFEGKIALVNDASTAVSPWHLEFDASFQINSIWDGTILSKVGNHYDIGPAGWNNSIPANGSVSFGFVAASGNPSPPVNYKLNGQPLSGAGPATLSATGFSLIEGNSGTTAGMVQVTLSAPASSTVSVAYATQDGTAKAGSDYLAASGTITFSPGQSSQTISITVLGDTEIEPNESFSLLLSNAVSATITHGTANITITTDDFAPAAGYQVGAYYTEWSTYGRNYQVADIPADRLTYLLYAFAQIDATGRVAIYDTYAATEKMFPGDVWNQPLRGNFNQLRLLKLAHPHLRTLISVGGWTLSSRFSEVARTPQSRAVFAQSAVDFITTYGFDGVDLDWEYPVSGGLSSNVTLPEDKHNFTLLCQELRQQLTVRGTADGRYYEFTAAVAAGWQTMANYELAAVAQYLDRMDVMTYDFHGGWENQTNHQAPLWNSPSDPNSSGGKYNVDWTLNAYLAAGVPASKIQMGLPLYNRAWAGVPATNHGLYQSSAGLAPGTWEAGVIDYRDMYNRLQTLPTTYQIYEDTAAGVPFIYAPTVSGGLFSNYENPASILRKMNWVTDHQLGGVFFWDLSSDLPDSNSAALVRTASQVLLRPPVHVQSFSVNQGAAQRSQVTEVSLTFDGVVTLPAVAANAFRLQVTGGTTVPVTVDLSNSTPNLTVARLIFPPLNDGRYTLTVFADQVLDSIHQPLDGDNNGVVGGNWTQTFHRLFGDVDGDGAVSSADFIQFRLSFGGNNPIFDFDNNGSVDATDFIQFRLRFGGSV